MPSHPSRNWFRPALGWLLILFLSPSIARPDDRPPELVASSEPRTPEEERAGFHLPAGFVMELVACEPDIHKPMNLAFDARGRLWVTSSLEYPFPKPVGEPGRDAVVILGDFAPDGRARSVSRFAEGLNIPIGVLPLREGALVHSIPDVHHMTDTNGDGVADRDEVWYGSIGFRDTHGMTSAFTWGFDGWIYACHGFANDSTVKGRDGQEIRMNSGNTYRFRPDGSHLEQYTWGQVNPFGLSFDARGDLFSCDCHSRPIMMLLRGGYYPSFGKPHDGLGFAPEMMNHDHGSTGIGGIVVYEAEQFPEPYRSGVFIGNVVTSKINLDRLEWRGSSPAAIAQPDFVVSDDPWFRPVDIELGPDGALYVADFYNRIIGHYEVPLTHPGRDRERGRIWRIRYVGDQAHAEARSPIDDWHAATTDSLYDALGHANLGNRIRAANELSERGASSGDLARRAAADETSRARRAHGLWILQRIGALTEDDLSRAASDPDRLVRIHAMRVIGEAAPVSENARRLATEGLSDEDPFVRRAAAEALGRHPAVEGIRPLIAALHRTWTEDAQLVHTLRIALRNQLMTPDAWPAIDDPSYTEADMRRLADVAPGVSSVESARFLLAFLERYSEDGDHWQRFTHHVTRRGDAATDGRLQRLLESVSPDDLGRQAALLQDYFQGLQERGAPLPEAGRAWAVRTVGGLLHRPTAEERAAGLSLAGSMKLVELRAPIEDMARRREVSATRQAAMQAVLALDAQAAVPLLSQALQDAAEDASVRQQAAALLGQSGLDEAREALFATLPVAPEKLQAAIAVQLAGNVPATERLLDLLSAGKVSPRILQDRALEVRLKASKAPEIESRLAELTKDLPAADATIMALIDQRRGGFAASTTDAQRGAAVFEKNCAACHQIHGKGERIGPQLDGVGLRGTERLLEDVLDPNRNVDQAFRVTTLALKDGRVASGLLLREEGEIVILADSKGQEQRVDKSAIEDRQLTALSPMPANMAEQVSEDEFYDLLRFLLESREQPEKPAGEGQDR